MLSVKKGSALQRSAPKPGILRWQIWLPQSDPANYTNGLVCIRHATSSPCCNLCWHLINARRDVADGSEESNISGLATSQTSGHLVSGAGITRWVRCFTTRIKVILYANTFANLTIDVSTCLIESCPSGITFPRLDECMTLNPNWLCKVTGFLLLLVHFL